MSNNLTFEGKLTAKINEKSGVSASTGKAWNSIDFLVEETGTQYPQKAVFSLFNDKCDLIEKINIGCMVKVCFNMNANESKGNWYGKCQAWKVENLSGKTSGQKKETKPVESFENVEDLDDNLPF